MRVLVELFDKEPIENLLGACIFEPDIVVFLCDERDSTLVKESAVYRLLRRRRLKTRPRFYYFDATSPEEIRRVLAAVAADYPGCVVDITGGRDLVLLEAGAFCSTHAVPVFFIDLASGRFVDVRGCAELKASFAMPAFSADDVFALTGATIHGYGHFTPQELDDDFARDALAIWNIVVKNPRAWGDFVGYLQLACNGAPITELSVEADNHLRAGQQNVRHNPIIFQHLAATGVISDYHAQGRRVRFRFKSAMHKKGLLNQGLWLELFCYLTARQTGWFDDVRTSVVVDWDGVAGGPDTTKNEVDVLLVKGITPVFVSCKMGLPSPLALSEIRLLSAKFGGASSRTVLVTAGRLNHDTRALQARAADLNIHLLDFAVLTGGSLAQQLVAAAMPAPPPARGHAGLWAGSR